MSSERDLRGVIAELAALHPDDLAAVLELLDTDGRKRIEVQLAEWSPFKPVEQRVQAVAPRFDEQRVSPWLVARMWGRDGKTTQQTRDRLLAHAVRLYPLRTPARSPRRAIGLFGKRRDKTVERVRK
jgi:hypothetical protein